eukprot:7777589-Alexandrium_andersonii.AAC.1
MRANCRLLKVRDLRCVPIAPGTIRSCLKLPEPARKRPKVPERSVTSWRSGQMLSLIHISEPTRLALI